jgi:hypothetical protein
MWGIVCLQAADSDRLMNIGVEMGVGRQMMKDNVLVVAVGQTESTAAAAVAADVFAAGVVVVGQTGSVVAAAADVVVAVAVGQIGIVAVAGELGKMTADQNKSTDRLLDTQMQSA